MVKNILYLLFLITTACTKDSKDAPGGPSASWKPGQVYITVSYNSLCENKTGWGKITIGIAATPSDLAGGKFLAGHSFITGADTSKEALSTLLASDTYYYKVSLQSYCKSHADFEETGSFNVQSGRSVTVNVTIK